MKKSMVVVLFIFFVLVSGVYVSAMEHPISVKTTPDYYVKIYAWTSGTGPLLGMDDGDANDDGIFSTTFFSLNPSDFRLQVIVLDKSDAKVRDDKFDNIKTDSPIYVNCRGSESCVISTSEILGEDEVADSSSVVVDGEVVEESSGGEIVEGEEAGSEAAGIISGDVIENGEEVGWNENIFVSADGTINWPYSIGAGVIFVLMIGFLFVMISNRKSRKVPGDDIDEELAKIEDEVRKKDAEIKKIKDEKQRKQKVESAKMKLIEEERELRALRGENQGTSNGGNSGGEGLGKI
ncbi:MAG: hypothetical protein ABIF88_01860 [archaeon]